MAGWGVLVSAHSGVDEGQVRFGFRLHPAAGERPFVVLQLGSGDVTMHVWNPETLTSLAAMVAEARELLSAAITGQHPLPVELTAALA